jgi:hypothetical protein
VDIVAESNGCYRLAGKTRGWMNKGYVKNLMIQMAGLSFNR